MDLTKNNYKGFCVNLVSIVENQYIDVLYLNRNYANASCIYMYGLLIWEMFKDKLRGGRACVKKNFLTKKRF
jgi:hypothetical protein